MREVGCGRGFGSEVILDRLGAERVTAFDLDDSMVQLVRRRLHGRPVSST
jgi:trans-aconitate methyltransferase